ncbi:MAG: hypothetical protein HYY43_03960 [Deltaproteobacteria bacterium]|nr:hypothetical protein [Deltaproteobacteria bacterium]MBI2341386.1 hypothetical protein [Deltaproteobacteria bacterium]MBI2974724.1 hypothetical protein [Deltaproteobacteria bacterium]
MFWGIIVFISAVALLVFFYVKDRHYEKKSVAETMSENLWDEIAKEREGAIERSKKFKEAIEKARKSLK